MRVANAPSFALWWLALLALHSVAAAFFAFCALFYAQLKGTYLDACLQYYGIGMATKWHATIALLMGLIAAPHALMAVKMLSASLFHRSLVFTFDASSSQRLIAKTKTGLLKKRQSSLSTTNVSASSSRRVAPVKDFATSSARFAHHTVPAWMLKCVDCIRDRHGIFGVEGQHFHALLFCREVVETALQSTQAYHMSMYVPRVWLNRVYVSMIVLNCWLLPLVHWVYRHNEVKKRLVCLVGNCALDLVSSIVIPCAILASYIGSYDPRIKGFKTMLWYDDIWLEHVTHEFQLLLVISWRVLMTRLVFSGGMLVAMSDIKELVEVCTAENQIRPVPATATMNVNNRMKRVPRSTNNLHRNSPQVGDTVRATGIRKWHSSLQEHLHKRLMVVTTSRLGHYVSHILHGLLCVWGLAILVLHVYAELRPEIAQCLLQVRPWGRTQPACSLMLLNCYSSGITGCASEIERQWAMADREMVVRVLIRHCSALEMPSMLQQFPQLRSLKVYNSTVLTWSERAAITNTFHPNLVSLFLVRVNLTSGELPVGLLSTDFPAKLVDIEFSMTNLRVLPSDLDTKWPKYGTLYLEKCAFTEIPSVALKLQPVFLSFQGNPIQEIPSEIFNVEALYYLHVGDTLVTELHENVTLRAGSASLYLVIANTQVARFPSWIDDLEFRLGLFASGSPLCFQKDPNSPPAYERILNASNTNVEIMCKPSGADPVFPVYDEDKRSALHL